MMNHELTEAYLQTSYIVETTPPICLRIGQQNSALDELLKEYRARTWAFVTAHNPESKQLSDEENEQRERFLRERLMTDGYQFLEGKGVGDNGVWPEERSVLILGITRDDAVKLGRDFGQNAIVAGELAGEPELVFCGE